MKYWMGLKPTHCQLCGTPLKEKFVDGQTLDGRWAILCMWCHLTYGMGLGTGRGQIYNLDTLEKLEG